jgi:hypothetical protein
MEKLVSPTMRSDGLALGAQFTELGPVHTLRPKARPPRCDEEQTANARPAEYRKCVVIVRDVTIIEREPDLLAQAETDMGFKLRAADAIHISAGFRSNFVIGQDHADDE